MIFSDTQPLVWNRLSKINKNNEKIRECHKLLEQVSLKYNLPKTLIANKREIDMYSCLLYTSPSP